jgi:hypothetical protein
MIFSYLGIWQRWNRKPAYGVRLMVLRQPQNDAQVMHYRLEDAGIQPAPCLLIDCFPWGRVIRSHLPRRIRPHKLAQGIEYFSQTVHALWGF